MVQLTETAKAMMILENQKTNQVDFPHYKRVGDYLLGEKLGEGSFAKVRVGLHVLSREKVAVKIINKEKARKDPYVYKNLRREGRLLQRGHHKHVIGIYDTLETENNYYLITELISGGEMIDMVEGSRGLPESQVRRYITQILSALQHLHRNGLVHRDLKVENLLLDENGDIKIIDFGLSNFMPGYGENAAGDRTGLTTQCGSPAYAAPELLAKRVYGPKVDVWSAGVVTYALLTGRLPFTVEPFKISSLYKKMINGDMNHIPSTLSKSCKDFIHRVLTANPDKRPTVDEIIQHRWLKEAVDYRSLVSCNENMMEDEESRTLNSDVIRLLTTSLGFNFSEVIASVQKHRPSRVFATYELLNKKFMKSATNQPKIVSLRDVKKEMEKTKENQTKKQNQSESDSGFENKSSSSETEMAKKKPEEKLPLLDDKNIQNNSTVPKTKIAVSRHNSTAIPKGRPVRLPRIDGSLDRLKSRKVTLPQAHRIIQSLDVETARPNAYDEVIRPSQRSSINQNTPHFSTETKPKVQLKKTATMPAQSKPKEKPQMHTDVTALLRTYKKYGTNMTGTSTIPMRQNLFDRNDQRRTRLITLFNDK